MSVHKLIRYPWSDEVQRVQFIAGRWFTEMNDDDSLEFSCLDYLKRMNTPFVTYEELCADAQVA